MSSRQLYDLTPQELSDHAHEIYQAARRQARAAWAAMAAELVGAETAAVRAAAEEAVADWVAATEAAARAAVWAASAKRAVERAADAEDDEEAEVVRAEYAVHSRAEAIANLDILHREQMMGEWSRDINAALINEQTKKAVEPVTKQEVKKHMGSMLGDWDKAGKLSKRRIRKTKTKTKRRRQKITKRRRK